MKAQIDNVSPQGKRLGKAEVICLGDVGEVGNDHIVVGVDFALKKLKSSQKFSRDAVALRKKDLDPDAQAFVLGADGKVLNGEDWLAYYGQTSFKGGVIEYVPNPHGFNRYFSQLGIKLNALDSNARVRVVATIDQGVERQHHLGMLIGIPVYICRRDAKPEVINVFKDLGFNQQSIILGDFYCEGGKWYFAPDGETSEGGLGELCASYGIEITEKVSETAA